MRKYNTYFSCGFFPHSLNFEACGLKVKPNVVNSFYSSLTSFLERGYPTRPTHYLEGKIEDLIPNFSWEENVEPTHMMVRPFKPNWDDTIKGFEEDGLFPARQFFNYLIEEHLPDYSFIKNLIVPECKFRDILASPVTAGANPEWAVDFFLPCANLVIEIDGSQHDQFANRVKDNARDRILRKHGITTHRIAAYKIEKNSAEIRDYFKALEILLASNKEVQEIKAFIELEEFEESRVNFDLIALARLQRVIVELLKNKTLKSGCRIELKSDFKATIDWSQLAVDDLRNTYNIVRFHSPKSPVFPDFNMEMVKEFTPISDTIQIDLSLFKHSDDTSYNDQVIRVLNSQINETFLFDNKQASNVVKIAGPSQKSGVPILKTKRGLKKNIEALNGTALGLGEFRSGQHEIISAALESHAVLGLLPTGGGKSLCFQSLGLLESGCSIVVCPITALIRDHVLELEQFGFTNRAAFISAEISPSERNYILDNLSAGKLKFLFLSPEQFQKAEFRQRLSVLANNNELARFVIDEVHCISEWGHDFRTAYLNLADTLNKYAPNVPVLCLTATAAVKVIDDIQLEFQISDDNIIYNMSQSRTELEFEVRDTKDKINNLKALLKTKEETNSINKNNAFIVFAPTINDSSKKLGVYGISQEIRKIAPNNRIGIYSGKEPKKFNLHKELNEISPTTPPIKTFDQYKVAVQKQFKRNQLHGIISTKSFGMGVNKPNVRLVVHYGMPQSLESLYQEAGRAGRDKKQSHCITLFTPETRLPAGLHLENTSVEQLQSLQKDMQNNGGDLSQQLWFLTSSIKVIETELDECCHELEFMRSVGPEGLIETKDDNEKIRTKEKVFYRLKQLGFVRDWTVTDFFRGTYLVEWLDQTKESLGNNILKTIKKYSTADASIRDYEQKIFKARDLQSETERELIKILLQWNYDHFAYQRRQSLKNVYEACINFENSKSFKAIVESYFQTNKAFTELPDIINQSAEGVIIPIKQILLTKGGALKSESSRHKMTANLMRYLEGYRDNPGLNLLSSLLRLAANDFENPDGKQRFEQFLDTFSKADGDLLSLEPLTETISKFGPELAQNAYTIMLKYFDDPVFAKIVLKYSNNIEAANILIVDLDERLERII